MIANPPIRIYVNKIENRITFRIETGDYFKLSTLETIKLFGRNKSNITKDKNGENVANLEITEAVLVHHKIVNKDYQQDSSALYIFVPNKLFGQLLYISFKHFIFLKVFNLEFSYIEEGLLIKF